MLSHLLTTAFMMVSMYLIAADKPVTISGIWEGESKCMVANSPCHDEHVIYDIKADPSSAAHFSVDGYKVISGQRAFMGMLDCQYPVQDGKLRCIGPRPDDVWTFSVSAETMAGTLVMGPERKLYRKVNVARNKVH